MKKKKFNFFEKIMFGILFGISSICLLGAWTIDNNGNLQSDNLINAEDRTGRYWVSPQEDISNTINQLPNGTYTISCDLTPLSIDSGYEVANCFFWLQITGGQYSTGDGIHTQIDGFTSLNQTKKGSLKFTKQNYTNYVFNLWGFGNHGGGNHGVGKMSNIMLNSGSTALPYEPYGTWYSQTNYEYVENEISLLTRQVEVLEEQIDGLQASLEQITQEYEDYQDLINNTVGITSFDISQYSVSVGHVPNQPSFDYTKNQDLTNNFSTIGYLNISDIYTNYILPNNGSTNNTIYITTPQSNLLTFDLIFNYITQPNTMLKTTLTLPDGTTQQFLYSSTAYDYKEEWTLANLVSSTSISENYNMNDISYKDLLITWENIGNNLSDIKIGSNNGFNTGFNNGYNTSLNKINEIQQELNSKTSLLEKATIDLQNKTNEYNMLLARYQQVTETPLQLNFQNLIWTIASSPFESFKQIWNVDILGFNIANFVIGVMSVFVVMYIIKKIF